MKQTYENLTEAVGNLTRGYHVINIVTFQNECCAVRILSLPVNFLAWQPTAGRDPIRGNSTHRCFFDKAKDKQT